MKSYYLRLKNTDLTLLDNQWVSGIIDLYDTEATDSLATPSYVNYSTTHSQYGTNLLGNNIWTGFDIIDDSASPNIVTDSGYVKNGRFVDTTGKINVTTWNIDFHNISPGDVKSSISYYYVDNPNLNFPSEWPSLENVPVNNGLYLPNAPRYARIAINLDSEQDLTLVSFDVYIKVLIAKPVISPLYRRTIGILNKFPEWMELRNDSIIAATPSLATPTTVAGSFVNAISGEWLDSLFSDIGYLQMQAFIDSADTEQLAWVYVVTGVPDIFVRVTGDGVLLSRAFDAIDFSESTGEDDIFYWDEAKNVIYTRKPYTAVLIDDTKYSQSISQVWNWFDEHGLTVDLERHTAEDNESYKNRIIDVYKNKPGVGIEAFKLALRRELNLWIYEGATPDYAYSGATPEVLEMRDILSDPSYVNADGNPTNKFKDLIDYMAEKYPTTWGYFKWGQAYWDIDGEESAGYGLLPYSYDAGNISDENTQSGVGDDLDLYIYNPNVNTGTKQFDLSATARGFIKSYTNEYAPINCLINVYGMAEKTVYSVPETKFWVNFKATTKDGKEYWANSQLTINQIISNVDFGYFGASTTMPLSALDKLHPNLNWYDVEKQIYIGTEATSLNVKLANIAGSYVFQMPRDSVYNSSDINIRPGNKVTLYSGSSYIFGTIESISQYSSLFVSDSIDLFDYITISGITYSGDITSLRWTLPKYLNLFSYSNSIANWLDATPSTNISSVKVGFGRNNIIPNIPYETNQATPSGGSTPNATYTPFQSKGYKYFFYDHASPTSDKYYAVFGFSSGLINLSTPNIQVGNKLVFHRLNATISGKVYSIDTNVSESTTDPVKQNAKTIALAQGYSEYILLEMQAVRGDWEQESGWECWNNGYLGVDEYPSSRDLAAYFSNRTNRATPSNYIESKQATPGTYLSDSFLSFPDILVGLHESTPITNYPWRSDAQGYQVTINGGVAANNQSNWTTSISDIIWDPNITSQPTKQIVVELITTDGNGNFGAFSNTSNSSVFIPKTNIYVNGSNNWVNIGTSSNPKYAIVLASTISTITVSVNYSGLTEYPIQAVRYDPFEKTIPIVDSGFVDENGPWKNNIKPKGGPTNYAFSILQLNRENFQIPNNQDYIVNWIGVSSSNNRVIAWIDQNSVKPAFQTEWFEAARYQGNLIEEYEINGKYYYSPIIARVKLKTDVNPRWNPQMHSGWFYDRNEEYYFYVDPITEIASPGAQGATQNTFYAQKVARQGAPIIVETQTATPVEMRQVAFFDGDINLTLKNTQYVPGTGTSSLYLAYENIYDATVSDLTTGDLIINNGESPTNALNVGRDTEHDHVYEVFYKLKNSFYVDHEHVGQDGDQKSKFVFDSAPTSATPYSITYENSTFDFATPIDIPLNPSYTSIDEGFVFISFNEYDSATPIITMNPGSIIADGSDYAIVGIRSVDSFGNPKPNVQFIVESTFGKFDGYDTNYVFIKTNNDGFAFLTLLSENESLLNSANIFVSEVTFDGLISEIDITDIEYLVASLGISIDSADFSNFNDTENGLSFGLSGVNIEGIGNLIATLPFSIEARKTGDHNLYAMVDPPALPADGKSATSVYGKVLDNQGNPVPYAYVSYRKGRSVYEVFSNEDATPMVGPEASPSATPLWPRSGKVKSDKFGVFRIGPFVASTPNDSGYWFMSVESFSSSPSKNWDTVGDVVYWQEYPPKFKSIDGENQLVPIPTNLDIESRIWIDPTGRAIFEPIIPEPATINAFPVTFDESTPQASATPVTNIWNPPKWYAVNMYDQYQRGMLGDDFYAFEIRNLPKLHPDYRDI